MKKKIRPLNDVLLDMEKLLREMTDEEQHSLQYADVLFLIYGWLQVHAPQAQENYTDGGHPVLYYGPAESLK